MHIDDLAAFFKRRSSVLVEYLIMLIVTVASILMLYDRLGSKSLLKETSAPVTISGEYSTDGGVTFTPFISYDDIDMRHLNNLIIRGNFNQDILMGHKIYMFLNYIDVTMYVNDRIVYTADPEVAYCWDAIDSLAFGPHDEVVLELSTRRKILYNVAFRQFLNRMSDSTKNSVISSMLYHDVVRIIGNLLVLIMGILVLQNYVEVRRSGGNNREGILSCAVGIVAGALGAFINADYITLILPTYEVLEYIDTLTQIYTVVFIMSYLRRYIVDEECKRRSGVILVTAYNITLLYMLWRAFFRGSSYNAMIPVMIAGLVAAIIYINLLIKDFRSHQDRITRAVAVSSVILLLCILLEIGYYLVTGTYKVDIFEIGLVIFSVAQYVLLVDENIRERRAAVRAKELENELMQSNINIMVSQIQPHFMYNALSTIRALISRKPDEARTAIDFFTKYIRANMDSLGQKSCIPFRKELEHVESYLYIEKLRFGDMLNINYDIQAESFVVPAMTVQTMAENAVKHGLLAKESGGTLTIRSRETPNCYEIQIEDDGVGFDSSGNIGTDDTRSHVGIDNSRKRLAAMCGGTLSIGSKVGTGTTVTITIPKQTQAS